MKSFPAPLTSSEEKYYFQKYTEGDLQAKHILIEHNLRLVAHVIKKYQSSDDDIEDLISIGTIGLIKSVMTFNSEKGNRLAAYDSKCIDNEILMYLRSKRKQIKRFLFMSRSGLIKKEMKFNYMISLKRMRTMLLIALS